VLDLIDPIHLPRALAPEKLTGLVQLTRSRALQLATRGLGKNPGVHRDHVIERDSDRILHAGPNVIANLLSLLRVFDAGLVRENHLLAIRAAVA